MISKIKNIKTFLTTPNKRVFLRAVIRAFKSNINATSDLKMNLIEAYKWLCCAQDATPDDGVAAWYDLLRGWLPSYPETTGYIIPTFLKYSKVMSEPDARNCAIRMADWEIDVQLPTGAVRSGTMAADVAPAVFNTGQVLFGWIEAYKETADKKYISAIEKAATWLIKEQDNEGVWRKNLSLMTHSNVQTYNVRTAWGLALAGCTLNEDTWITAARKNCDWALKQQQENGWFANNAFTEIEAPLLHTIGYVLEGLAGIGKLLEDERYLIAVQRGIEPLVKIYERTGSLKGEYDSQWNSYVSWRCLTGEAQIALVLYRLFKYFINNNKYAEVGHAILEGLSRVQDTESQFTESRGGFSGSEPVWGGYIPWCYINWAVKFFMDALFLDLFDTDVH